MTLLLVMAVYLGGAWLTARWLLHMSKPRRPRPHFRDLSPPVQRAVMRKRRRRRVRRWKQMVRVNR